MSPHRRLGLRARVTLTFSLGALGLSVVLSLLTYGLTRRSVVHSRQSSAVHQTLANALVVRNALRSSGPDVPQVLASLETPAGSDSVLRHRGSWFATSLAVGRDAVPVDLAHRVVGGQRSASEEFVLAGHPEFAVGVPLAGVDAQYFELFDLEDVSRTLAALAISLAAASAATTVAGLFVGRWASRRALYPLTETTRAAALIAGGDLETRLEAGDDADLANLASSFNSMVTALQRRIQRDARFASDVSHELRSPLTTLAAAVEVLERRRDELPERSARALELLADEVRRFQRLVADLLEVSRFDAGVAELSLEQVRPVELVRHTLAGVGMSGVPVKVDPDTPPVITADKRRLERVLANLLANAEVHGGGAVRVAIGRSGRGVRLAVDDAGPGVPPESARAVFERFARGAAAGDRSRHEGVGLGLSIAAEHVRLHGGEIGVEPSPEGGARFWVDLPAAVPVRVG